MTTPTTPTQIADLLDKAADKLDQRGLAKGANWKNGRVCATGAIRIAVGGSANGKNFDANKTRLADQAIDAVDRFLQERTYRLFRSITTWNDDVRTSQQQVVAVLRDAAAGVRAQAEPAQPEPAPSEPTE